MKEEKYQIPFRNTVGPPYLRVLHHAFNQLQMENIQKKNSRKFQKAKLEFAAYPATIYIAFTLYEVLKVI